MIYQRVKFGDCYVGLSVRKVIALKKDNTKHKTSLTFPDSIQHSQPFPEFFDLVAVLTVY